MVHPLRAEKVRFVGREFGEWGVAEMSFDERAVIPGIAEIGAERCGALEKLESVFEIRGRGLWAGVLEGLDDEVATGAAAVALGVERSAE